MSRDSSISFLRILLLRPYDGSTNYSTKLYNISRNLLDTVTGNYNPNYFYELKGLINEYFRKIT